MTSSSKAHARQRNVPPPDAGAAKAPVYSRFIPREELSSFAAWKPRDLSGAGPAWNAASSGEPTAIDPAQHLAEQVHLARQTGYQDGYRDGLIALEGFKQSFAQQTTMQIGSLLQSVGGQLDGLQQEMAEAVTVAATHLARQIVRSELTLRPESVAAVAEEAIDTLLLSARHITLRVHPDDHAAVASGAGELLAARGARLVADAAISRGGCLVESNIGVIDASIETRWRRATAALGHGEPWAAEAAADRKS
ncbi:MAG: flagellar assembly protein FliH [Pseudomonadota bacterium]|nr:flagellar assembly protein FliH [Pseudomonadota bacterium]